MARKATQIVKQTASTLSIQQVKDGLFDGIKNLALAASGELTATTITPLFETIRSATKALENIETVVKKQVVALAKTMGTEVEGTKGTRQYVAGGFRQQVRPTKTGLDPKKLEALLRAKGADPAKFMQTTVTYAVSEDGTKKILDKKVMTADELKTCHYNESWTVLTPEPVSEEE